MQLNWNWNALDGHYCLVHYSICRNTNLGFGLGHSHAVLRGILLEGLKLCPNVVVVVVAIAALFLVVIRVGAAVVSGTRTAEIA